MKRKTHKNQLISYIHALSGKSYKEARQICKAAKWNEEMAVAMALNFDQVVDALVGLGKKLAQSFNEMGETIQKLMNNLGPIVQGTGDSMRQLAENMRQNMIQNDR